MAAGAGIGPVTNTEREQGFTSASKMDSALRTPPDRTSTIGVLLIDGDSPSSRRVARQLAKQGLSYRRIGQSDPLSSADDMVPDAVVVVLDASASDARRRQGLEQVVSLRREGVNVPLVLVANRELAFWGEPTKDAVNGLRRSRRRAGGFDFRLDEVVEVLQSIGPILSGKRLICGRLVLRPDVNRAYWDGCDLDLSLGEYRIVHLLASNVGFQVSYRDIYDRLHYEGFIAGSGPDGYRANVRAAIRRLRCKLRERGLPLDPIENVPCFGYRWTSSSA